jgi:hypothetical protein
VLPETPREKLLAELTDVTKAKANRKQTVTSQEEDYARNTIKTLIEEAMNISDNDRNEAAKILQSRFKGLISRSELTRLMKIMEQAKRTSLDNVPRGQSKASLLSQLTTNPSEEPKQIQVKLSEYTDLKKVTPAQITYETFKKNIHETSLGPQSAANLMHFVDTEYKKALAYIKKGNVVRYEGATTKEGLISALKEHIHIDTTIDAVKKLNVDTSSGTTTRAMASSSVSNRTRSKKQQ